MKNVAKKGPVLTKKKGLDHFLSCSIELYTEKKAAQIGQLYLLKEMCENFGDKVKSIRSLQDPYVTMAGMKIPTSQRQDMLSSDGIEIVLYLAK